LYFNRLCLSESIHNILLHKKEIFVNIIALKGDESRELREVSKRKKIPNNRKSEMLGLLVLALTILLFLALVTDDYHAQGQTRRYLDGMTDTPNLLGMPGALLAAILAILVGDAAHVLYAVTFIWGLMLFTHRPLDRLATRFSGMFLTACSLAGLLQIDLQTGLSNAQPGGAFGAFVADRLFVPYLGLVGANVVGFTFLLIGILLSTDFLFIHVVVAAKQFTIYLLHGNLALLNGFLSLFRKPKRVDELSAAETLTKRPPVLRLHTANGEKASADEKKEDRTTQTVRILTQDIQRPLEQELPFDAVPSMPGFSGVASEALEDKPKAVADDLDAPSTGMQLELMPAGGGSCSAEPKRRTRKARRRIMPVEELPPDYEYPRQYSPPPINLFDLPTPRVIPNLGEQLRATSALLEDTLQTFGVEAHVTDITRGPTITRFELEPAPGVKVSRFLALADDIALALKAHRVRVEAPIPGKGRVGIEVPNAERDQVLIRELLASNTFARSKGKLNLAMGKDIAGEVKIADLASMPHLLVAGATGAGKTVCVKALLASLLFKFTPDELQLMLIDPKMVELSIFNDIPHLITPVVTDPKKASTALTWLISEMEERYRLFAELRVRNIEVYNQSVENGEIEMEGEDDAPSQSLHLVRKLPYIVCIIDELADLMMLARAEVEDAIARLAQLARAVGIHLIIATQRPSVDVLTGVIKANFPARVSFQVSSRVDSRCILDEIGAERLIGQGDLLYLPAGQSKPTRIQGAFVSDQEMNSLIAYLKTQAPPQYRDEIENFGKTKESLEELVDESDPLFDEAVRVVLETGQASISMVQRRLRVGYTRAARLIDMMELRGIVGPHTGSKAREILVDTPPPPAEDEVA